MFLLIIFIMANCRVQYLSSKIDDKFIKTLFFEILIDFWAALFHRRSERMNKQLKFSVYIASFQSEIVNLLKISKCLVITEWRMH